MPEAMATAARSGSARRPRVVIVQRRLPHYRESFFEALRTALEAQGIDLTLVVGEPTAQERLKQDEGVLGWAERVRCHYLLGGRLCWQDIRPWLREAQLVIVAQESKLLFNWLALLMPTRVPRLALWGHGCDFMATSPAAQAAQRLKAWLSRRADWWFPYTDRSAEVVRGFGFPSTRMTILNNAGDTSSLAADLRVCRAAGREALRRSLGLGDGPVGLYIGSFYAAKRLDLLLQAARIVRARHPGFELVLAGAGPDGPELAALASALPWVRLVGVVKGSEKARWMAASDLLVLPAAVGLAIVDGFAAGLPALTSRGPGHGPEIDYLQPGVNGLLTERDPQAYADAVCRVLGDPELARRLSAGAEASAAGVTQQAAVERFSQGIVRWLREPRVAPQAVRLASTAS
jgi:glycosyltransferase involved in cell wall biosynthesis